MSYYGMLNKFGFIYLDFNDLINRLFQYWRLLGHFFTIYQDIRLPNIPTKDGIGHLFQTFPHPRGSSVHTIDFFSNLIFIIQVAVFCIVGLAGNIAARIERGYLLLSSNVSIPVLMIYWFSQLFFGECSGVIGENVIALIVEDGGEKGGSDPFLMGMGVRVVEDVVVVEGRCYPFSEGVAFGLSALGKVHLRINAVNNIQQQYSLTTNE